MGLVGLVLLVIAIAKGASGWLMATLVLVSVAFFVSSVNVYRSTSRERP